MEREKYIFSLSQSRGIEYGRQLLLEHRAEATRFMSEVSVLAREKRDVEEMVGNVLKDIGNFEEGVSTLEERMLVLSSSRGGGLVVRIGKKLIKKKYASIKNLAHC